MNSLTYPDLHFLRAATGWIGLKNLAEAESELNIISKTAQLHPDVLDVRWTWNARALNWVACVEIGEAIVRLAPQDSGGWIHRSFALHELKRTAEALEKILPAVELFPEHPTIIYNIACYHSQLGDLPAARHWLSRSFTLKDLDVARARAIEDPDLEPLWKEIPDIAPLRMKKRKKKKGSHD